MILYFWLSVVAIMAQSNPSHLHAPGSGSSKSSVKVTKKNPSASQRQPAKDRELLRINPFGEKLDLWRAEMNKADLFDLSSSERAERLELLSIINERDTYLGRKDHGTQQRHVNQALIQPEPK